MASLPKPSRDTLQRLAPAVEKLLALALAYPALIQEGSAQEAWLLAPAGPGAHDAIHRAITTAITEQPELDSDAMAAYLETQLSMADMKLLRNAQHALGMPETMDELSKKIHASRMWSEVLNDIHLIRLKAELAQAEQDLALDCSEANLERVLTFRAQVDTVMLERSKFYREDPLPSVAEAH